MSSLITKFIVLIGLGIASLLPVVIVAYISRFDVGLASDASISFAYTGLVFTVLYFGQRAYLSLNAEDNFHSHLIFRLTNTAIASLLVFVISFFVDLPLFFVVFAISIKLSESLMDLRYGYAIKVSGVSVASKEYMVIGLLRLLLFGCMFAIFSVPSKDNYIYHSAAGILFFFLILFYCARLQDCTAKYNFSNYFKALGVYAPFAMSALSSGLVTAGPRIFLVGGSDVEIQAIALSLAPLLGLLFQTVWISNLSKLNDSAFRVKKVSIFTLEVAFLLVAIFIFSPVLRKVISVFYGGVEGKDLTHFVEILLASAVFFFVMALLNLLKLYRPGYEFVVHALGVVFYCIAYVLLKMSVPASLCATSIFMLSLLFVFSILRKRVSSI
ncbi:hypothetical protein K7H92_04880 [Pseudomonas stutzeri]|nr:hypothetical protein [Stutzerimonas stutzeri]